MNIGFAALAVFALLAPGFGLVTGMRAFSRFDIKTGRQSHTAEIIMLLLLASLLHIGLFPSYDFFVSRILGYHLIDFLEDYKILKAGDAIDLWSWTLLFLYVPFSSIAALLIGCIFIKAIEHQILPIGMFHGAMYKIISKNPIIYCSILTNITYEDCHIMYRGILSEISYSTGYKIDYICLASAEKYLAKIEPVNMRVITGGPKTPVTYESDFDRELFVINDTHIANVLFTKRYNLNIEDDNCDGSKIEWFFLISGYLMSLYCVVKVIFFS